MESSSVKSLLGGDEESHSPSSPASPSSRLESPATTSAMAGTTKDTKHDAEQTYVEDNSNMSKIASNDPLRNVDAEFGGTEERKRMEKKLLRRLDARMSIMVVIYILNYVSQRSSRGRQ